MENYTWHYIQNHPKETRRLLGIDYEQLERNRSGGDEGIRVSETLANR